jgi:hypothetical protein
MRSVNNIDGAVYYLHFFHMSDKFSSYFSQSLSNNTKNQMAQSYLTLWVKKNFRFNMILFLLISVFMFHIWREESE